MGDGPCRGGWRWGAGGVGGQGEWTMIMGGRWVGGGGVGNWLDSGRDWSAEVFVGLSTVSIVVEQIRPYLSRYQTCYQKRHPQNRKLPTPFPAQICMLYIKPAPFPPENSSLFHIIYTHPPTPFPPFPPPRTHHSQTQPIHAPLLPAPLLPYHPQPVESLLPAPRSPAYIPFLPAQHLPEAAPVAAAIAPSSLWRVARAKGLGWGGAGEISGGVDAGFGCYG